MVLKKVMVWSEVPEDVCDSVLSDMIMKTETLASNETGMTPQEMAYTGYNLPVLLLVSLGLEEGVRVPGL